MKIMDTNQQFRPDREYSDLPPDAVDGTVREATLAADLLCDFLTANGLARGSGPRSAPLPLGVALQFAAALRIQQWEDQRLREHVPDDLPSADVALAETLTALHENQPPATAAEPLGSLARRYFVAWFRSFSWRARTELGIDVVLANGMNRVDATLRPQAEFAWQNRHPQTPESGGCHGST